MLGLFFVTTSLNFLAAGVVVVDTALASSAPADSAATFDRALQFDRGNLHPLGALVNALVESDRSNHSRSSRMLLQLRVNLQRRADALLLVSETAPEAGGLCCDFTMEFLHRAHKRLSTDDTVR